MSRSKSHRPGRHRLVGGGSSSAADEKHEVR